MLLPYFLDSLVIGNEARQNAPSALGVGVGDVDITERERRRHSPKIRITLCQRDMPTTLTCGIERGNIAGSAYFIVVLGVSPFCMKLQRSLTPKLIKPINTILRRIAQQHGCRQRQAK